MSIINYIFSTSYDAIFLTFYGSLLIEVRLLISKKNQSKINSNFYNFSQVCKTFAMTWWNTFHFHSQILAVIFVLLSNSLVIDNKHQFIIWYLGSN